MNYYIIYQLAQTRYLGFKAEPGILPKNSEPDVLAIIQGRIKMRKLIIITTACFLVTIISTYVEACIQSPSLSTSLIKETTLHERLTGDSPSRYYAYRENIYMSKVITYVIKPIYKKMIYKYERH